MTHANPRSRARAHTHIPYAWQVYCLDTAAVLREHAAPCRINAVHAAVGGCIYMACQDGSLVVLRPGGGRGGGTDGGDLWDEVEERRWAEPADAPLSCMHVREGNTSLVAVASRRGIHVLTENEAGVNPLHFLAFARTACCAGRAASIGDIFAQVLLSSACTVHYLDRGEPPATFVLSPAVNL